MKLNLKYLRAFMVIACVTSFSVFAHSQSCNDTLYVVNNKCYNNGQKVSLSKLNILMSEFPESKQAFTKLHKAIILDAVVAYVAGTGLGLGVTPFLLPQIGPFNQALHLGIFTVGLGVTAYSIIRENKREYRLLEAVSVYNAAYKENCK
ncbi:MAG: hypothetical protein H3C45_08665 [Bacteroidia bacterium]|nr:hypothetical protein [Bacteroidia bacterium]